MQKIDQHSDKFNTSKNIKQYSQHNLFIPFGFQSCQNLSAIDNTGTNITSLTHGITCSREVLQAFYFLVIGTKRRLHFNKVIYIIFPGE